MMYDELDWEDIESRLYSQVYHASSEIQDHTVPTSSDANDGIHLQSKINNGNLTSKAMKHTRYFNSESDFFTNTPIYISIENRNTNTPNTTCNSVQNNITFEPNEVRSESVGNFLGTFQNNITVNQYNIPVIINPPLDEGELPKEFPDRNGKYFSVTSNKYKKFLQKKEKRRQKRSAKRRENKKKAMNINKQETLSSLMIEVNMNKGSQAADVICVSDESNSECVVIDDTEQPDVQLTKIISTGFPKKYNEGDEDSKKPESDDDIIYIPPPPVEVINVDVDEDKEKELDIAPEINQQHVEKDTALSHSTRLQTSSPNFSKPSSCKTPSPEKPRELLDTPESSVSNDFLENASIENNTNNFNFSLHGADFNSAPGDFVRPAKPVEFCETESSCSTNDLNRDFNNSVKTIVFDEVEFPRADIFSENNLETFGSLITPKRSKKTSKHSIEKSDDAQQKSDLSSSDSSSETDFESSDRLRCLKENKKLPNLSPMQMSETPVSKKKSKKKTALEFFKEPQSSSPTKKDLRKRKSESLEASETDSDSSVEKVADINKKQVKKKHKLTRQKKHDLSEVEASNLDSGKKKKQKSSDYSSEKPQCKKKNVSESTTSDTEESDAQTNNINEPQRRTKKTCTESKNLGSEKKKKKHSSISKTFDSNDNTDIEVTVKKKKKKSCPAESTQIPEDENNKDTPTTEKVKKRKSHSTENSENEEMSKDKKSKKRRKSCSTSSNKSLALSEVDEYIEVELLDEADRALVESYKNDVNNLEAELYKLPDEKQINPEENLATEENENSFDNALKHTTENYVKEDYSVSTISFATISKTCAQDNEPNDSDEEIIVDDESSFIVVDDVNCTTINDENIEVVLSSDSEGDFKNLADVGDNLELANCTSAGDGNLLEEIVVVDDDNSASNSTGRHTLQKNCYEFDVEAIQRSQTDDPDAWKISHKDRIIHLNSSRGPRCNRCRHFGHIAVRCTEKTGPPVCTLCGSPGHQEPRCTKKICTQCGNEGDYSTSYCWKCFKFRSSTCRICNMRGHIAKMCPDLWRRYHLTTEEGPIVVSQEPQLKPRDAQWCSGCAKRGHLEHECNYYNRAYPPTNPCIMSYEDICYNNTPKFDQGVQAVSSVNMPSTQNLPTGSSYALNANVASAPPPMSSNMPLALSNQNPAGISSNDKIGTSRFIPPLMSLVLPPVLDHENRVVMQSGANIVVKLQDKAETSTKASNSSSAAISPNSKNYILNKMRLNYLNKVKNESGTVGQLVDPHRVKEGTRELFRNDQRRIKHMIMTMPCPKLREFLKREMADLEDVATQTDPTYLKKMIFRCNGMYKTKKPLTYEFLREQCFWNRILNMFLFGVHKYKDGALHIHYLQGYLSEPKRIKLGVHKRRALLSSYNYIFGVDRHANISYLQLIHRIIEKGGQARRRRVHNMRN